MTTPSPLPPASLPRAPVIPSKNAVATKPDMTEEEARDCVTLIISKVNDVRAQLLDLYERKGWKALGYASWRECAATEFGKSAAYLYRQLEAGRIEREISPMGEIGEIPERNLREIKEAGKENFIKRARNALATKDPKKIKKAVSEFARERREEKKESKPNLNPHLVRHEDAAPESEDWTFDTTVAQHPMPKPVADNHIFCPACKTEIRLNVAAKVTGFTLKESR